MKRLLFLLTLLIIVIYFYCSGRNNQVGGGLPDNLKTLSSNYVILEQNFSNQLRDRDYSFPFLLYNIGVTNSKDGNELLLFGRVSNYTFDSCVKNETNYRVCKYRQNIDKYFPRPASSFIALNKANTHSLQPTRSWDLNMFQPAKTNCYVAGIEDARPFWFQDKLYSIAAISIDQGGCKTRQLLCEWNSDGNNLQRKVVLSGDRFSGVEKNWGPFVHGNHMYMIQNMNPMVILEVDPISGYCVEKYRHTVNSNISLRNGKFICSYDDKHNLGYCHHRLSPSMPGYDIYFFLFEKEAPFTFVKLSKPIKSSGFGEKIFCFPHQASCVGQDVIFSLGIDDMKGCLAKIPLDNIKTLFNHEK